MNILPTTQTQLKFNSQLTKTCTWTEKATMKYVYLDWNVIQYMKHSTIKDSINGSKFYELIKKLSGKYQFPFSEGHLKDLAVSFKPENKKYIDEDLNYINQLADGYALCMGENENLLITDDVNIHTFFNEIVFEVVDEPFFDIVGKSYNVDMKKLPKDNLFQPFLELNNGVLNSSVFKNSLSKIWSSIDDPEFYKLFREQISKLKYRFNGTDTILNQRSKYFKNLLPLLDFMVTKDVPVIHENFDSIINSFLSINGRKIENMTEGEKIEIAYMLLDFHPSFRDKINKKNRPSNIYRDVKNLFFASQAKYYVTEDQATLKKARFVCEVLNIKVKVVTMSEFTSKFC